MTTALLLNEYFSIFLWIYFIAHSPAIILIISALSLRKSRPNTAKRLAIGAGIYFLIGAGICGSIFL